MSTRCEIGIYKKGAKLENPKVLLYKHCDGYPNGVVPEIKPFLEKFQKNRGLDDYQYLGARLMQYMCNIADESLKKWSKEMVQSFETTGYGIMSVDQFQSDIEYYYAIYPDALKVYECSFDFDNKIAISKRCKLLKTHKLK